VDNRIEEKIMDYTKIAIADVLKHPIHGIISHQPIISEEVSDRIRVMDLQGNV